MDTAGVTINYEPISSSMISRWKGKNPLNLKAFLDFTPTHVVSATIRQQDQIFVSAMAIDRSVMGSPKVRKAIEAELTTLVQVRRIKHNLGKT